MDFVETDGDTIDQAIENALKRLGVARDKITVDVYREGERDSRFRRAKGAGPRGATTNSSNRNQASRCKNTCAG